jgi:hypothetical protein
MQSQIGATAAVNQCWRRMKHPSIRRLFDYWNERRGARLLPRREDIEPEAIRCVLADTFILSFAPTVGHPIRVAGTRVCALFGREIKGEAFLDVFSTDARGEVSNLISVIADESVGVVGSASEQFSDAHTLRFEFLLLPLSLHGAGIARLLGALVRLAEYAGARQPGARKLSVHRRPLQRGSRPWPSPGAPQRPAICGLRGRPTLIGRRASMPCSSKAITRH